MPLKSFRHLQLGGRGGTPVTRVWQADTRVVILARALCNKPPTSFLQTGGMCQTESLSHICVPAGLYGPQFAGGLRARHRNESERDGELPGSSQRAPPCAARHHAALRAYLHARTPQRRAPRTIITTRVRVFLRLIHVGLSHYEEQVSGATVPALKVHRLK